MWRADFYASRQLREAVTDDGGDAVTGETEQADGGQTLERVRLDLVNIVVVQQDHRQVRYRGESASVDDRQLIVAHIEHLRDVIQRRLQLSGRQTNSLSVQPTHVATAPLTCTVSGLSLIHI